MSPNQTPAYTKAIDTAQQINKTISAVPEASFEILITDKSQQIENYEPYELAITETQNTLASNKQIG